MEKASKNLDYEKAAIAIRDKIKALTQIQTSQKVNQKNLEEADVVSIFKKSQAKPVFKYSFLDQNKIGEIKHFFQNTTQMIAKRYLDFFYFSIL